MSIYKGFDDIQTYVVTGSLNESVNINDAALLESKLDKAFKVISDEAGAVIEVKMMPNAMDKTTVSAIIIYGTPTDE